MNVCVLSIIDKWRIIMALIQMSLMSQSLLRTVPVSVVLPADKMIIKGKPVRENKPYKTLYLLHGIYGSNMDWLNGTNIYRWAEERDLAVVMPSGDNMFYIDQEKPHNYYGEFIGKELVELTRKIFPLSHKREDTYIAGLSMGGYGAVRNGLKYYETFGYIAGLSSAFVIEGLKNRTNDISTYIRTKAFAESCFGALDKVEEGDLNPLWLAKELIIKLPCLYLCCGNKDFLLETNKSFYNRIKDMGYNVVFEVGPGGHDWDFWNGYIKKVLEWLPLEEELTGLNSGNVEE